MLLPIKISISLFTLRAATPVSALFHVKPSEGMNQPLVSQKGTLRPGEMEGWGQDLSPQV